MMESNLDYLYDYTDKSNKKHGFMMMKETVIKEVVDDYIRYNKTLIANIQSATGFDVTEFNKRDLYDELESNISLMVLMTYAYYIMTYDVSPTEKLEDIAKCYIKYYDTDEQYTVDEFVTAYTDYFINN